MVRGSKKSSNWRCMVCGSRQFLPFALRSDGVQVVRCTNCDMGVIEPIPDDLSVFYGDDYYGGRLDDDSKRDQGYLDYAFTAEHGVGWAAALVKLLRPAGGRVLDIGCADGHLLAKLGPDYAKFGVEATEAAGRTASARGVTVLGRDLNDPALLEGYRGSFDVVTAIAVFEHLRDIRAGVEAALHLLRDDGVLVFEVPLMSTKHDNTTWFTSSLEHVWYPSEAALKGMIQDELGAQLVGCEVFVTGYASNYVGLVCREGGNAQALRELGARILTRQVEPASPDEAVARMLLHLVHAATTTHSDLGALMDLPLADLNPPIIRRLATLWQGDLWRLQTAWSEVDKTQQHAGQLQSDLDAARSEWREDLSRLEVALSEIDKTQTLARQLQDDLDLARSDHILNRVELTASLANAQAQLAVAQADLAAYGAAATELDRQRAALDRDRTAAEALLAEAHAVRAASDQHRIAAEAALAEVNAVRAGAAWRVAIVLGRAVQPLSRLMRTTRRAARVLGRASPGRLIKKWGPRRRIRVELLAETGICSMQLPDIPSEIGGEQSTELLILKQTGHRPPLAGDERPENWPLVSVVITSFNYGHFVAAAVDSVLAQTFKDLEVIVVEGGSSDPTSRFTVAGLERPRTRVLMQGAGHRAGANRNFGISQARGRYVCCLDADDTLAPTYIEKAVFLLERHGYDVISGALKMVGADHCQVNILEQPSLEDILEGNHVLTCAVFRRSLWEEAGGYRDVDSTVSGHVHEDWAFWARLAALGARFRNLFRDPVLRYRVHAGHASLSQGKDVLPRHLQREMIRKMNHDLLQSLDERVAISRKQASVRYGTPSTAPAPIILDRALVVHRPPTLLLAMPFLLLGGAERLLSTIVGHLVQMGWRVVVTTSIEPGDGHGDTTAWFEQHTCEIFHLPRCYPPEMWEDFVHHLVRSREVDIVWVAGSAFMYDCLRGLRAAYPHLRVADLLFNTVGHTANNRRRRDLIDLNFVENNEVHGWLMARGEDASRVSMVESGVDLTTLRPMPRSASLVKQIGAGPADLIIGFSGRWSEEKNPLGFVEIARLIDPRLPVRFVMTGTGDQRSAIEQAIRAADFPEGRFHLLGEVPEIASILASLDLLVIPSVLDGRPVVALEALALGVPILASRVGALPDLIQNDVTGWICEPNDAKAFAWRIEQAILDRVGLKKMRLQARAYAEAKLDVRRMTEAYRRGLESLLPEDRRNATEPAQIARLHGEASSSRDEVAQFHRAAAGTPILNEL